ncbi:MAG: response regulator [Archangiaceae bacterium]|nr:response regulator [Archangiaceae bacterium]
MSTRVLVVDDNAAFAENLDEILADAGYQVTVAPSCAAARSAAGRGFDIALVDMRLPDGLGTDLAGELRQHHPDAVVVLLTGYSTVEAAAAAVRAGVFAYLSKPCATDDLLLTLEQARRHVKLQLDKRELQRRALTSEKLAAVGTMTAGLSHEIRNPLNAAGLQLQVLERRIDKLDPALRPPLLEPLTLVRDEIRRLDHLLEDFLQLARPRELVSRPVDLSELAGRVLDLLARDAERRGVTLERHLAQVPPVAGDDGRLRQVVMNLALNALEASSRGKVTMTVAAPTGAGTVVLIVDDTGPGVPPELRERIFEPFFTTKAQGTGLGLAIVHGIVAQHGGTLTVSSAPGGGARFTLELSAAPRS